MATVTVRLIHNFEHRSMKPLVLHNIDLNMIVKDFEDLIRKRNSIVFCLVLIVFVEVATLPGFGPYRQQKFGKMRAQAFTLTARV